MVITQWCYLCQLRPLPKTPKTTTATTTTTTGGAKASAAGEAAFLDKPFFLAHDHWTHQQMLSSSTVPPDLRPGELKSR